MNLLSAWLQANPGTKAEAFRELNTALGTDYTSARLYEWAAGSRPTPRSVELYLIKYHLRDILLEHQFSLTKARANELANILVVLLAAPD